MARAHSWSARLFVGILTVFGTGLSLAAHGAASTPKVVTGIDFTRLAGADLYGTAATIATSTFGMASSAVLASGASPFDAGAANFLAGALKGPVLLTAQDSLPTVTLGALASLHVSKVVVVGGPLAVSDAVVSRLQQDGYSVSRIAGDDQYQTAADVAMDLGPTAVGTSGAAEPTANHHHGNAPGG